MMRFLIALKAILFILVPTQTLFASQKELVHAEVKLEKPSLSDLAVNNSIYLPKHTVEKRQKAFNQYLQKYSLDDLPSWFKPGDGEWVGNGGGYWEGYVEHSLAHLDKVIVNSFHLGSEDFQPTEQTVIQEMIQYLNEYKNKINLYFISEKNYPGFFSANDDPTERIAKTNYIKGAPIFLNLDYLHETSEKTAAIIITTLVHEIGHHLKIGSHHFLNKLGAKISQINKMNSQVLSFNNLGLKTSIYLYNFYEPFNESEILFIKGEGLTARLTPPKKELRKHCPKNSSLIGHHMENLHRSMRSENPQITHLKAWIRVLCQDEKSNITSNHRNIFIQIVDHPDKEVNASYKIQKPN